MKNWKIETKKLKKKRFHNPLFHKLLHKPIIVSKDDMDKFEEQEIKKIRPIIRNWFDQLIKQNVMGEKSKIILKKLKDKIINDIWTLFQTEQKKQSRKKKQNEKIINDKIVRDIRTLFNQKGHYYELKRVSKFWNNNYIEYESNGDKKETYHLMNILTILNLTWGI